MFIILECITLADVTLAKSVTGQTQSKWEGSAEGNGHRRLAHVGSKVQTII